MNHYKKKKVARLFAKANGLPSRKSRVRPEDISQIFANRREVYEMLRTIGRHVAELQAEFLKLNPPMMISGNSPAYCEPAPKIAFEWLLELSPKWREAALKNIPERSREYDSLADVIGSFIWSGTNEGYSAWDDLSKAIRRGRPLPDYPE